MTSTALISEKERLYHFYVTCNMTKEETCKTMGYYCKHGKNKGKPSRWFLEENIRKYNVKKPIFLNTFNLRKSIYLLYGVDSIAKLPEIQAKKRITCLKRYGTEYYMQTKEYKEQYKRTCLKKYGVENIGQAKEIQEKIKITCLKKYGVEYYTQTKECQEKIKQTCLKKYGVEYSLQSIEVQNKSKFTNLERYGTENIFSSEYGKEKIKQTNLERYNVVNPGQSKEFMNKAKQTKKERYGYEYYNNREKTRETCLKKYNCENVTQVKEIRDKQIETKKLKGTLNTSKQEKIIKDLLNIKFKNIEYQYKSELYPFNCDFYIPELDLYIEFQGHWTHGKYNGHYIGKFDCNNEKHKIILNEWQKKSKNLPMYKSAIEVWTIRDPLKRKIAKENNLNWLEFFTIKDFMIWYNSI